MLAAVSGGADSVALLRLMQGAWGASTGRLVVVHFHHHLRAEADDDAAFVCGLGERLGLKVEVGHASQSERGMNEAEARNARFDFFRRTADAFGARYVATGHTRDDQAETILHRIVRGTSLTGLAGMRGARALSPLTALVRPLLEFGRAELRQYLADQGQGFRTDASNTDPRYTRNRIRHELLPKLAADYNPEVAAALVRLGQVAAEAQAVIDVAAEQMFERAARVKGETLELATDVLREAPRHLAREVFVVGWRRQGWPEQAMGFAEWERLASLLAARSPGAREVVNLPGEIRAEATDGRIRLSRAPRP